jgi:hypothetical protein
LQRARAWHWSGRRVTVSVSVDLLLGWPRSPVVTELADEDELLRVVSSGDPVRYSGHAEARARQLGMVPEGGRADPRSLRKALAPRPAGHLWTLRNPAGLTVALRARDFPMGKYARRDARAIASRRGELETTHVVDLDGRQRGWWLSLDGRVVLTSARIRGIGQRGEAEREVRAVLRLLIELAETAGQK